MADNDSKHPASTQDTSSTGLERTPAHLQIEVIHQDEDILVVHKPCNLRSVPGNADPPPTTTGKRKDRDYQDSHEKVQIGDNPQPPRTTQEAWVEAIKILARGYGEAKENPPTEPDEDKDLHIYLKRLGAKESQRASIPRRYPAFSRYIQRSRSRIFGEDDSSIPDENLPEITQRLFRQIEAVQKEVQQRPAPTTDEESVVGQCKLLGLAKSSDSRANQDLFVVHRLDCQTSGVLVLARTAAAASYLSECWRTRHKVHKTYRALVEDWPPFRSKEEPQKEGEINLPMSQHPTERLKWVVVNDADKGKESLTKWKVLQQLDKAHGGGIVLELKPITGRTHQLRVHCAATGGTIRGDSLYGKAGEFLYLHAEKLSFPHPSTKEMVSFEVEPKW